MRGSIAFFLETKPFRELTESDTKQAVNYGRSKNKRWAVLSNFQETLILICDTKEDTLRKHVFKRIAATDLISKIGDLWLLSKEGFEEGTIENEAQGEGRVKKTVRIDDELLTDVLTWRSRLYASIKKYAGSKYSRAELEEIVQTLLDRIIFIRTALHINKPVYVQTGILHINPSHYVEVA